MDYKSLSLLQAIISLLDFYMAMEKPSKSSKTTNYDTEAVRLGQTCSAQKTFVEFFQTSLKFFA